MGSRSAVLPRRTGSFSNHDPAASLPPLAAEAAKLLGLYAAGRVLRPGQEIVSEGRRCTAVFLIMDGMAVRYRVLRDGQRQILNFLLPGDFAGTIACRFKSALHSVRTLTQTVIAPIPVAKFIGLSETHPSLAAKLLWSFASEAAIYAEHLITVGRRPASARIAHFLLELLTRLQAVGLADERSYRLPLTQEMISDALGLSVPYVNRVLRELRDSGLVRIRDQQVIIDNLEELAALAEFEHHYLRPLPISEVLAQPSGV